MADNLEFWNKVKAPPTSALKKIIGGRLKGKTDISPVWRYQVMTEHFGMIGFGWKYEVVRQWTEKGANEELMAFVDVNLYVKVGDSWSESIPGNGGSMIIAKESGGLRSSDEAYKMATTDALSVAMKMLGVAADIYLGLFDGSKYVYDTYEQQPNQQQQPLPRHQQQHNRPQQQPTQANNHTLTDAQRKEIEAMLSDATLVPKEIDRAKAFVANPASTEAQGVVTINWLKTAIADRKAVIEAELKQAGDAHGN